MEDAYARCLLDRIDDFLRTASQRSSTRGDFVDALLELRLLASDLITLGHLETARRDSGPRRTPPRWRTRSRTDHR